MKPEDKAAFDKWCPYQGPTTLRLMLESYKFGLSRRDEAPAVAINEQLLESLENLALACGRNDGWEDYPQEMKAANAAIRAAEAAKGGA